jgi:peptidoglycan/LPS O-acetylase OafA/YrhL
MTVTKRNPGLDFIRSLAIVLVLYGHSVPIIYHYINPALLRLSYFYSSFFGVELFFILSGFLIGRILLVKYFFKETFTWHGLTTFWKRRWWRTLPNFYLVLLVYFALHSFFNSNPPGAGVVYNMFFLQNFFRPNPLFFAHSWSLSVEEWFYLLIPLQYFLVHLFSKNKTKTFLWLVAINIFVINLLRFIFIPLTRPIEPMFYMTPFRLDAILYGVLLSFFYLCHKEKVVKHKWVLFFSGLMLLAFSYNGFLHRGESALANTIYVLLPAITAPCIALLFPVLIEAKYNSQWSKFFLFTSTISYSLYLLHPLVELFVVEKNFMLDTPQGALLGYICFWVVSFFLSYLLYQLWEKRFLDYRNQYIKE